MNNEIDKMMGSNTVLNQKNSQSLREIDILSQEIARLEEKEKCLKAEYDKQMDQMEQVSFVYTLEHLKKNYIPEKN